ncbi:MAG: septum site-determining protein MinC [Gammaproteobacteria bacterium]
MLQSCQTEQTFSLKSGQYTITTLQLLEPDLNSLEIQLREKIGQAPKFFNQAPIVLDLTKTKEILNLNLSDLIACFKKLDLVLVALKTNHPKIQVDAHILGIPLFSAQAQIIEFLNQSQSKEQTPSSSYTASKTVMTPVRSGQQIYAKDSDLILLNTVSPGAEIMADGNVHVYSTVKGRILAGLRGNRQAMIFCQHLQAELISIAGSYKLSEDIPTQFWGKSVIITWHEEGLVIKPL